MPDLFLNAYPFADDLLDLPVADIDEAADYYSKAFGLTEVERQTSPPSVVLERGSVRLGFSVNGRNPEQEGAAILVSDAKQAMDDLKARGVEPGSWRVDERDGKQFQVFFVVAPDGLCYYFHQALGGVG